MTLAIGAYRNNGGNGKSLGHVRVLRLVGNDDDDDDGPSWKHLDRDILDGETGKDYSGWSLAISTDGNIFATGADENNGNGYKSSHVRVYRLEDNDDWPRWQQLSHDIDGERAGDYLGTVSLSADDMILAIEVEFNDGDGVDSGHVRVYMLETGGLT